MTSLYTAAEIAAATGGTASADFTVTGVTFDSREVGPGDLFIALTGELTDGHRFLAQAFAQGAAGAIVSQPCDYPHVLVADTMAALESLARAARARTSAVVIGVTGSVGKTGTKEALAAALDRSDPGATHKSVKSYNNHTGVPLSLARMPAASRFAVLEMGMNHAGELTALTGLLRPHIAIVTAIAPAHTAFFSGVKAIADAKAEIFSGLQPGGTAIIPFDSPYRDRLIAAARMQDARIVTFGTGEGADVRATETLVRPAGTFVLAKLGARELSFTIGQPGEHWVSNALAIIAAVDAAGGDFGLAGLALGDLAGLPGRGARSEIALPGGGTATLFDESYNANPASMRATLAVLAAAPGRRIAVLGEMRELGDDSSSYHSDLAGPIEAAEVAHAILVGEQMRPLAQALSLAGRVHFVHVADAAAARAALEAVLAPGDAVLVKGSNALGLAAIVRALNERCIQEAVR
nr:UDP-N-acetylmuramoyl-tripeptide--D-alanyl-D-alanine ligase [Sphingomonas sp. 37zxx]